MKYLFKLLVLGLCALSVACSTVKSTSNFSREPQVDLIAELTKARKPLLDKLVSPLVAGKALISTSFVNIDNLSESSTFGRMAADVIAGGLTQRGLPVIELKLRDSLFIKQGAGEFMLSRQLRSISQSHDAQAVLVGTYAVGGSNVYVNARLVRSIDNVVLASYDFNLPLNKDLKPMLNLRRR